MCVAFKTMLQQVKKSIESFFFIQQKVKIVKINVIGVNLYKTNF